MRTNSTSWLALVAVLCGVLAGCGSKDESACTTDCADASIDSAVADAAPTRCSSGANCAETEFCDLVTSTCQPKVCDPDGAEGQNFCEDNAIKVCNIGGGSYSVSPCEGGQVCQTLSDSPFARCECEELGELACSLSDNDVYAVDSCGARVSRVEDCALARQESCLADESGVRCSRPLTCRADGSGCASYDHCVDGVCMPDVCTPPPVSNPNSRRFCDGNVVRVCNAEGSGYAVVADCGAGGTGQICTPLVTDPGAACRCTPDARRGCDGGDIWSFDSCGVAISRVTDCTGSQECIDAPTGPICAVRTTCTRDIDCGSGSNQFCNDGVCIPRVCTPAAERCYEQQAQRCDARGAGWERLDDCAGGSACTVTGGSARCACAANASQGCSTGDVYEFDSCGVRGARVSDCVGSEVCVATASGPRCEDPGPPVACRGALDCGADSYCGDGFCRPFVCVPGATFCEEGAARRCDPSGGTSVLVDDCDAGETCEEAAGEARCVCTPNASLGCSGGDVYRFDSCGHRLALAADCTGTATCVAVGTSATCVAPPPVATGGSAPACSPRASQGCYQGDVYWLDSCGIATERAQDCTGQVTCNTVGGTPACRSSVSDTESRFWSRSCPLVQDIEFQTDLPADCRCFVNRSPVSGITSECAGLRYVPSESRLGTGPDVRSQPQSSMNGGVIVGRELFVGAGWSNATRVNQGFVMGVNLDTGNRRLVSGGYLDPSTGFAETGTGPSLHRVLDVARGADGNLYALSVPSVTADLEIVRIAPATGARTRVWKGRDAAFGQCASGDPARLAVTYHDRVFGVSASGEFYLAFRGAGAYSEGVGLVRIAADGASCSFVTRSGAGALNAYASRAIGGGYELDRGYYGGLAQKDGALYVLSDVYNALFRVDVTTGDRVRVSSAATSWGVLGDGPTNFGGLGQRWLAWDEDRDVMWATGVLSYRAMVAVDLATGTRTEAFCRSSNTDVPWRNVCLGGVLEGGYQNFGGFWIDPANGDAIVVHENHALVRVDLQNGNSMRFSF